MLGEGLCPLTARVLANLYTNQSGNVRWGNTKSANCKVINVVKLGGILSSFMFALYIWMKCRSVLRSQT